MFFYHSIKNYFSKSKKTKKFTFVNFPNSTQSSENYDPYPNLEMMIGNYELIWFTYCKYCNKDRITNGQEMIKLAEEICFNQDGKDICCHCKEQYFEPRIEFGVRFICPNKTCNHLNLFRLEPKTVEIPLIGFNSQGEQIAKKVLKRPVYEINSVICEECLEEFESYQFVLHPVTGDAYQNVLFKKKVEHSN